MRRQFLPRLLIRSWMSRTQLAPYKPGNYALCRGCALSTTLTPGVILAALEGTGSRSLGFCMALVSGGWDQSPG